MAITEAEAKAWLVKYQEGFLSTTAPYYGVNTFDVRKEDWDAMMNNVQGQLRGLKALGGSVYLWAVTDLGPINRVVWINYYPVSLLEAGSKLPQEEQEAQMELTHEAMTLYDKYEWFCAEELPDGPTTIA